MVNVVNMHGTPSINHLLCNSKKIIFLPIPSECTLPLEYCEFMPETTRLRCKEWRENNHDELIAEGVDMEKLSLGKY